MYSLSQIWIRNLLYYNVCEPIPRPLTSNPGPSMMVMMMMMMMMSMMMIMMMVIVFHGSLASSGPVRGGQPRAVFGPLVAALGPSWTRLGVFWRRLGTSLGPPQTFLGPRRARHGLAGAVGGEQQMIQERKHRSTYEQSTICVCTHAHTHNIYPSI